MTDKSLLLFLTSKVRLHCDCSSSRFANIPRRLFLTSKVRLHCDYQEGVFCPQGRDFS